MWIVIEKSAAGTPRDVFGPWLQPAHAHAWIAEQEDDLARFEVWEAKSPMSTMGLPRLRRQLMGRTP